MHERNAPDDTFGFGVVFCDETLAAFEAADPESYAEITSPRSCAGARSTCTSAAKITSGGHGFSAMGRKELLGILQRRAARWASTCASAARSPSLEGDLVVAADGVNSTLRATYGFEPSLDVRKATYAWFGTDARLRVVHVHHRRDAAAASCRCTRIPFSRHALDVHRREPRGVHARQGRRARSCSATS